MEELYPQKYFPLDFREFIGNPEIVARAQGWAHAWNAGNPQKPLFLHGPTGVGKTCLALLLARLNEWPVFEMNASDIRSKDSIDRLAGAASQANSFSGKPRLVLLDEIDGLQARKDRGGAGAITAIIKESKNPVILTANNIYKDQKLAPIRAASELLQFKKVNYLSIAKRLKEICEIENIAYEPDALKELAKSSGGDVRAALSDLQTAGLEKKVTTHAIASLGFREHEENVFRVMETMFRAHHFSEVRDIRLKSEVSSDLLLRWIEENIPRIFTKGNDTARAFDNLSKADIFNGRIRNRQYYGFLRYSSELMSSGALLCREHDYPGWLRFQFPSLLRKLSASSARRAFKKGLANKIGKKTHSSARAVLAQDFPFLTLLFSNREYALMLSAAFDLNEKEIAFLMGTKPTTKKVLSLFAQAQGIRKHARAGVRKELMPVQEELPEEPTGKKTGVSETQTKLF